MPRQANLEIIGRKVGTQACAVLDLAECVKMVDQIDSRPLAVAAEIIRYLDDLVENP